MEWVILGPAVNGVDDKDVDLNNEPTPCGWQAD